MLESDPCVFYLDDIVLFLLFWAHNVCLIFYHYLFFFQMNKVFENARLKTAVLQERAFRYWTLFNEFMRCILVEQQALYSGCGGMHAGPWSARDLPGTPLMFRTFLWWLATPSVEVNPHVLLRTSLENVIWHLPGIL